MRGTPVRLVGRPVVPRPVRSPLSNFGSPDILKMFGELSDLFEKLNIKAKELQKVADIWEELKRGPKGDPGASVVHAAVVRDVAKLFRQPADGRSPTIEQVVTAILPHVNKRLKKLVKAPESTTVVVESAPKTQEIVDAVFEHLASGKSKIKLEHIEGIETKFAEVRNAAAMGTPEIYGKDTWKRGGGDTVVAGSGVTITTNDDGNKVINASGGSNIATEKLTPTQAGSSITLDLTGLSHTFTAILGVYKNGQLIDPSDPQFGWSRVGNTITVLNGFDTDIYQVQYTYA